MFVICFISQLLKRSKHGLFVFPTKENPYMEKALFDWPIVLQYHLKAKYRLIFRKFFGMNFFSAKLSLNQPKAKPRTFCIRSTNKSNRFISVRLFFLYCSRVFISRSYENALSQRPVCYLPSMFFTTNINYQVRLFSPL